MTGKWVAQQTARNEVHCLPIGDLLEHERADTCPCGPSPQLETCGDGSDAWLHLHHSLDGRERIEP